MGEVEKAVDPVAVPDGWKLVPAKMDVGMVGAWYRYKNGWHSHDEEPPRDTSDVGAYAAMLDAAPTPPLSTDLREENERLQVSLTDEVTVRLNAEARAATLSVENSALRETLEKLKRMAMLLRGEQAYREYPKAVLNAVAATLAREGKR